MTPKWCLTFLLTLWVASTQAILQKRDQCQFYCSPKEGDVIKNGQTLIATWNSNAPTFAAQTYLDIYLFSSTQNDPIERQLAVEKVQGKVVMPIPTDSSLFGSNKSFYFVIVGNGAQPSSNVQGPYFSIEAPTPTTTTTKTATATATSTTTSAASGQNNNVVIAIVAICIFAFALLAIIVFGVRRKQRAEKLLNGPDRNSTVLPDTSLMNSKIPAKTLNNQPFSSTDAEIIACAFRDTLRQPTWANTPEVVTIEEEPPEIEKSSEQTEPQSTFISPKPSQAEILGNNDELSKDTDRSET